MKKRREPTLPGDRHKRKCSGCGENYKTRSTLPTEKPLCTRCRGKSARAQERMAGWGWPLFSYVVKRIRRKPTKTIAQKR